MMTAGERLSEALADAAHRGDRWPCRGRDEWMSDRAEERAVAARACRYCPVLALCSEAADELDERHGVWGGLDREAVRNSRKNKRTTA